MAVISPSLDILDSAINTPTSTPRGSVKVSVNGIASANRYPTVAGGAVLRTRISNNLPTRCKNRTKVNRIVPSTALLATSRKIARENRPIRKTQDRGGEVPVLAAWDFWLLTSVDMGGGGTSGGLGTSSWTASNSISSNNRAGAITEEVVTKLPAPIRASGALESMKLKTKFSSDAAMMSLNDRVD